MLARIGPRIVIALLVGATCLGSFNGCDGGGIYGQFGPFTSGDWTGLGQGYVQGTDVYYPVDVAVYPVDVGVVGYSYDPYAGEYYDGYAY